MSTAEQLLDYLDKPWLIYAPGLTFTVLGTPQQQGGKNYMARAGGGSYGYEQNKNLGPWRNEAIKVARQADVSFPAGVFVRAHFYWTRPASHFGTGRNAGVLKPSAPIYKDTKPDADKIQRAIGDMLKMAGVIRDDSRIVGWDVLKLWGDHDRVEISIWRIT